MANLADSKTRQYSFGDVVVDLDNFCVIKQGEARSLAPRAFDLLAYLTENPDRVIEKQELFENVWKESFVTDNALTQTMKEVRRAIGDDADSPHYIMTIPKRGYRFIASVSALSDRAADLILERHSRWHVAIEESEPDFGSADFQGITPSNIDSDRRRTGLARRLKRPLIAASALGVTIAVFGGVLLIRNQQKPIDELPGVRSIAVLPFKPISTEARDEILELGIADNLITRLSRIEQIVVRPTGAVRKYATPEQDPIAAGRELKADSVLEGSIQRVGDRVRVTARLLRVADGRALWAGEFDEQQPDIFVLQNSISQRVAVALVPRLTGEEKERLAKQYTTDSQAYELYQKGRYSWNKRTQESLEKAISYFREAIARDPNYALAYCGLADSYALSNLYSGLLAKDSFLKARAASEKALDLDPALAEAHATLAYVKYYFEWDWPGAEREFKRAIEMNPNYATAHQWYGEYLFYMERFDQSLAELDRAHELDPISLVINTELGSPYFYMRQYDRAMEAYRKALEVEPGFPLAKYCLALCYGRESIYPEAIRILGGGRSVDPQVAFYLGRSGMRKEAFDMLQTLKHDHCSPYLLAKVHVGLGNRDQAFDWLDKAYEDRDEHIVMLRVDADLDSLRSDPRFSELLRRVGLPD